MNYTLTSISLSKIYGNFVSLSDSSTKLTLSVYKSSFNRLFGTTFSISNKNFQFLMQKTTICNSLDTAVRVKNFNPTTETFYSQSFVGGEGEEVRINHCSFINCSSTTPGGALNVEGTAINCQKSYFGKCSSNSECGAIYSVCSNKTYLINCCFYDCSSSNGYNIFRIKCDNDKVSITDISFTQTHYKTTKESPYLLGCEGKFMFKGSNITNNELHECGGLIHIVGRKNVIIEATFIGNNTCSSLFSTVVGDRPITCELKQCEVVDNVFFYYPFLMKTVNDRLVLKQSLLLRNQINIDEKYQCNVSIIVVVTGCVVDNSAIELFDYPCLNDPKVCKISIFTTQEFLPTLPTKKENMCNEFVFEAEKKGEISIKKIVLIALGGIGALVILGVFVYLMIRLNKNFADEWIKEKYKEMEELNISI